MEDSGNVPNAKRLLWAGFLAIFAAGVGFAIRGGIVATLEKDFGFSGSQLGAVNGMMFNGFCFGIIIGGIMADKIGYKVLIIEAFACHVASALMVFMITKGQTAEQAYPYLYWSTFIFGFANGTLEAVANPLVATIFPNNRTHYLNILHASWPAGMMAGALVGIFLGERMQLDWKIQLALYLVPVILYGLMFLGQAMPKSEASSKGLSLGEMFKDVGILGGLVACLLLAQFFNKSLGFPTVAAYGVAAALLGVIAFITNFSIGSPLLFTLFLAHALIGSVELGTDSWIQNITGNILDPETGKWLFLYTSLGMFGLRFCAHFIENTLKLSPIGLLLVCSVLACIGLNLVSSADSMVMFLVALSVYCVGKTFFWPTMLAVASDRFPRTGAIAISLMGGIGMMSVGMIGGPGLGYAKDRFTAQNFKEKNPALFDTYKAKDDKGADVYSNFPLPVVDSIQPLDGKKLGEAKSKKEAERTPDEKALYESSKVGDRATLKADSFIPATMALIYLALALYFKSIGGYKQVHIVTTKEGEAVTA